MANTSGVGHLGLVGEYADRVALTLSLDTNAYSAGDVLAATQELANAVRIPGGTAILQDLIVYDQDDVGGALDVYILGSNVAMGTENAAPSISDANALEIQARIPVAAADYVDLTGAKVAFITNIGAVLQAAINVRSLYVAVVNGSGTPTYTAAGLKLSFGMIQH